MLGGLDREMQFNLLQIQAVLGRRTNIFMFNEYLNSVRFVWLVVFEYSLLKKTFPKSPWIKSFMEVQHQKEDLTL